MFKQVFPRFTSSYSVASKLNEVMEALEHLFHNKVLFRDNPPDQPNHMENELDMNYERIINVSDAVNPHDAVNFKQLQSAVIGGGEGSCVPPSVLEGGQEGQVLTKASDDDLDFEWKEVESVVAISDEPDNRLVMKPDGLYVLDNSNPDPIVPPENRWRGERVSRNVNFTIPTSNFFYSVVWQVAASENSEFWSLASPSWLVVPAGVTKIRLSASVVFSPNATGQRFVGVIKNGSLAAGLPSSQSSGSLALVSSCSIVSAVLSVVEGDYFELRVAQGSGGSLPILPDPRTWFQIEVVEEDLI